MKSDKIVVEAYVSDWNRAHINYHEYCMSDGGLYLNNLYSCSLSYFSKCWSIVLSILIDMEKHNFKAFPMTLSNRDAFLGRVEEYAWELLECL